MPNPLNHDPSRTTLIRQRWMAELKRRFDSLKTAIEELIVGDDAFGLQDMADRQLLILEEDPELLTNIRRTPKRETVPKRQWQFLTAEERSKAFQTWLQEQVQKRLTNLSPLGSSWINSHVEAAYKKGLLRAYMAADPLFKSAKAELRAGAQAEFLRGVLNQPRSSNRLKLLYTRALDQLQGLTGPMGAAMSRTIADGLANNRAPRTIARQLVKDLGIGRKRAMTIARTETVFAHAEGQLDTFEQLGVDKLVIMAEWQTAGDDRVCAQCAALAGTVWTVAEARGLIPLHPNCRCAWAPVIKEQPTRKRLRKATPVPKKPKAKAKGKAKPKKKSAPKPPKKKPPVKRKPKAKPKKKR